MLDVVSNIVLTILGSTQGFKSRCQMAEILSLPAGGLHAESSYSTSLSNFQCISKGADMVLFGLLEWLGFVCGLQVFLACFGWLLWCCQVIARSLIGCSREVLGGGQSVSKWLQGLSLSVGGCQGGATFLWLLGCSQEVMGGYYSVSKGSLGFFLSVRCQMLLNLVVA